MTTPAFIKRRTRNIKNRNQGELFENRFMIQSGREDMAISVMPPGCRQVGLHKLVRVKTDYDYILTFQKRTALIDAKSFAGDRLTGSMIVDHQHNALWRHHCKGALAGYVIWWTDHETVAWVPADVLHAIKFGAGVDWNSSLILGRIENFQLAPIFYLPEIQPKPLP